MKNGVLAGKMAEMESTLRHLRGYLPSSYDELVSDWGRQKIVERALQILIEAMIDIGERIVALSGGGPSDTSAAVMKRLQELGVIRDAELYVPMVRFRNFLVHLYEKVDLEILYGLITKRLSDIDTFLAEIKTYGESA